nr:hypothetical protein [Lachnospiraceae bacterium]
MRRNWKRGLSLLLASSMAFSLNVATFAGEMVIDEADVVEEYTLEEAVGSEVTEASEEATYSVQADDTSTTTKTVSDPSADPSTWTTDPASAEK